MSEPISYLFQGKQTFIDDEVQELVELGLLEYAGDGTPTVHWTDRGIADLKVLLAMLQLSVRSHPLPVNLAADLGEPDLTPILGYLMWLGGEL